MPAGGYFTVDLSALPGTQSLKVEWLNPVTGVVIPGERVPARTTRAHFAPPYVGDAVLYLVGDPVVGP